MKNYEWVKKNRMGPMEKKEYKGKYPEEDGKINIENKQYMDSESSDGMVEYVESIHQQWNARLMIMIYIIIHNFINNFKFWIKYIEK